MRHRVLFLAQQSHKYRDGSVEASDIGARPTLYWRFCNGERISIFDLDRSMQQQTTSRLFSDFEISDISPCSATEG